MNPLSEGAVFVGRKGAGLGVKRLSSVLERRGKGYTEIVPNAAKKLLQAVIYGLVALTVSSTRAAGWGCDGLMDRGCKEHFRMNHGQHEFVRGNCPINGIESF